MGVFNKIFASLTAKAGKPDQLMIDATRLKALSTAASLLKGTKRFRNPHCQHILGLFRASFRRWQRTA